MHAGNHLPLKKEVIITTCLAGYVKVLACALANLCKSRGGGGGGGATPTALGSDFWENQHTIGSRVSYQWEQSILPVGAGILPLGAGYPDKNLW